jgi:ferredoxin-NADP reductase
MIKLKVFNYQTGDFQEIVLTPEATAQGECLIGRTASCDVILESPDVSRVHGRIKVQKGDYYFTDLGSANGSRLNHNLIQAHESHQLQPEDMIRIGDFMLLVDAIEATAPTGETSVMRKMGGDRIWTSGDLTVRCVRITDETPDVKTFTFMADPPVLFKYKPGQFVSLDLEINGESVLRSYSISSTPSRPHTLEITVKRVPAPEDAPGVSPGLVSNWLHDTITVGNQVKLSGPMGRFTCLPDPAQKLLLISAGSGITPMMSMARWLADTAATTDIVFFHCARTPHDIIFRQELELMAARLPNFHLAISTTRSQPGLPWFGYRGRLSESMVQSIAPDFQERTVYVCGPDGFMQGVKTLMDGLAFPMQHYHEESFGAPKKSKPHKAESAVSNEAASAAVDAPLASSNGSTGQNGHAAATHLNNTPAVVATQPVVVFSHSGKEIAAEEAESILDLAEQEGIKIRSNCRQGVCGACKKRKLDGEIRYDTNPDALDAAEQDAGYVLTCVACPVGRVVIEA